MKSPLLLASLALLGLTLVPGLLGQSVSTLHRFTGSDGLAPSALIQANDGAFYGTTPNDSTHYAGTIFRLSADGQTFTTLHQFDNADGAGGRPSATLLQGSDGAFYGTTTSGGTQSRGTIFRLSADGQTLTTLYNFGEGNGEGSSPQAELIQGSDGALYGTSGGGTGIYGTIFRFSADERNLTTLRSFDGNSREGIIPVGALLQGSDGAFYGMNNTGSTPGKRGAIFRLSADGRALMVLHSFTGSRDDGAEPLAALIRGNDGAFYGTTNTGGVNGLGTIFRLSACGQSFTLLHSFFKADGVLPHAGVIQGSDGAFYGTTFQGGNASTGTIYRLSADGQTLTRLHSFGGSNSDGGTNPFTPLLEGSDGALYGTTNNGGIDNSGTLFRCNVVLPSVVRFHAAINSVDEAAGATNVRVDRLGGSEALVVTYQTTDGTATTGTDYEAVNDRLVWAAGDRLPKFIQVRVANRQLARGNLRTFAITLTSISQPGSSSPSTVGLPSLGEPTTASVTINGSIPVPPTITSATTANAIQGRGFAYRIAATNYPNNYGSENLPSGLNFNPITGGISGKPAAAGVYLVTLDAANSTGTGTATLTLSVAGAPPAVTSGNAAKGKVGQNLFYKITATNSPTRYAATGLPPGLSVDEGSGLISGVPTAPGTFPVDVSAANDTGAGSTSVSFTIAPPTPPQITSDLNPPSRAGVAFDYQITVSGNPVSFTAAGLPGGLGLNTATGRISGKPNTPGTYDVRLGAQDQYGGEGTATLHLLVKAPQPVVTSAVSPPIRQGVAFGYSITATNSPTSYGVGGMRLPEGLSINQQTGRISGTPQVSGTFIFTIAAFNSGGVGTGQLKLVIAPAGPQITSPTSASATAGQPFRYQITARYAPTSFGASGLPTGLTFDPRTGLISGTLTEAGNAVFTIATFNQVTSDSAEVALTVR